MKRNLWRLFGLSLLMISLVSCSNPPPAEDSCNFVQNSFNRRVSWANTPVRFYIDKASFGGPDEDLYYTAIKEAMDVWNQAMGRKVLELVGRTEDLPVPRLNSAGRVIPDTYNGIYRVSDEVFQNTTVKDEQARTSISFRGDYIYEADILVDGSEVFYFADVSRSVAERRVQFKSLMIHEFGHVLGLGHIEDASLNSVMYPKLQFGQMRPMPEVIATEENGGEVTKLNLPEVDKASLSCEY